MKSYIKSKLSNNFLHKIWHWFKSKFDFIKNAFHSGEKVEKNLIKMILAKEQSVMAQTMVG